MLFALVPITAPVFWARPEGCATTGYCPDAVGIASTYAGYRCEMCQYRQDVMLMTHASFLEKHAVNFVKLR